MKPFVITLIMLAIFLLPGISALADPVRLEARPAVLITTSFDHQQDSRNFLQTRGGRRGHNDHSFRGWSRHDDRFFDDHRWRGRVRFRDHFLFDRHLRFDDHGGSFRTQICLKEGALRVCFNNFFPRRRHW